MLIESKGFRGIPIQSNVKNCLLSVTKQMVSKANNRFNVLNPNGHREGNGRRCTDNAPRNRSRNEFSKSWKYPWGNLPVKPVSVTDQANNQKMSLTLNYINFKKSVVLLMKMWLYVSNVVVNSNAGQHSLKQQSWFNVFGMVFTPGIRHYLFPWIKKSKSTKKYTAVTSSRSISAIRIQRFWFIRENWLKNDPWLIL